MADPRDHRGLSRALSAVTRILGTSHEDQAAASTRSGRSSVVDCALYVEGIRQPGEWDYQSAFSTAQRGSRSFVWLGLHEPAEDEFAEIANTFELHELAVEDAIKSFQRPKIERYGELAPVRALLESKPELLGHGPWSVAHAIYDRIVDSYVDCAAAVELDLDTLEESVFGRGGAGDIQRIYQLKRELVEFRRAVVPLQRPVDALVAGRLPEVPKEIRRYFRDVSDQIGRAHV